MIGLFFIPIVVRAQGPFPAVRVPKYTDTIAAGCPFSMLDYGFEPVGLVAIDAPTQAVLDAVAANNDVVAFPANLDAAIGNQRNTVRNKTRAVNLPAGWITNATTWRAALRTWIAACLVMQRLMQYTDINGRLFSQATLNTTWGAVPVLWQERLLEAFGSLHFPVTGITAGMTIEDVLTLVLEGARATPYPIGLTTI